jgi:hypothetical protein
LSSIVSDELYAKIGAVIRIPRQESLSSNLTVPLNWVREKSGSKLDPERRQKDLKFLTGKEITTSYYLCRAAGGGRDP